MSVKTQLRIGVKFLEHQNNNYIWLKLCKSFFGLKDDIYICFIYNPLEYSSYSRKLQDDILELIEKDISKYSNDGKIILAGDLNARTGTHALDFIPADNTINNIPIFENFTPDINLYTRHSEDSVLSTRGKTLNELCIHTGLRILNGRISGDFMVTAR